METVGWLSGSIRSWGALQAFFGSWWDGAVLGSWWELVGVGGVTYGCGRWELGCVVGVVGHME